MALRAHLGRAKAGDGLLRLLSDPMTSARRVGAARQP
jgi:hypothetical protein